MKKSFTSPFWALLILGIISVALDGVSLYLRYISMIRNQLASFNFFNLLIFLWPAIIFTEAIVYWRIRKRNDQWRESWAHVLLFSASFLTPVFENVAFYYYDNFGVAMDLKEYARRMDLVGMWMFWILFGTGHIFFVRVLVRSLRRKDLVVGLDPVNMLDDVAG